MGGKVTENMLIAICCEVEDLLKAYDKYRSQTQPPERKPTRLPGLCGAKGCTMGIQSL